MKLNLFLLCFGLMSIVNAQAITPLDNVKEEGKLQSVVLRSVSSKDVRKSNDFGVVRIDTIFADEYYKFHLKTSDNNTKVVFEASFLPPGFYMDEHGVISGITQSSGWAIIPLTVSYNGYKTKGVVEFYIESEQVARNQMLETSLDVFPNRFENEVNLVYSLDNSYKVSAKVYDAKGDVVKILAVEDQAIGDQQISWDARNTDGDKIDDGWYYLQFNVFKENDIIFSEMRRVRKSTRDMVSYWY